MSVNAIYIISIIINSISILVAISTFVYLLIKKIKNKD